MAKKIDINGLEHFKEKENAMIAGKPEATGTATATHAKGEYFYWKGTLHQATAAIAIGDTITLNTNVKTAVLTDDLCQLQTAVTQLDNSLETGLNTGILAVDKTFTWINSWVNTTGKIQASSASKTALVTLNAGETITVGTSNSNICIIGSTESNTIENGDTITVIYTTTNTGAFETYSYTATETINIVFCVRYSDYSLQFTKSTNLAELYNSVGNLNELETDNKSSLVVAINEVNAKAESVSKYVVHDPESNYINASGAFVANNDWRATGYCELMPNTQYYGYGLYSGYCAFYRSDKSVINAYGVDAFDISSFVTPNETAFARFSLNTLSPTQGVDIAWINIKNEKPSDYGYAFDGISVIDTDENPCDYDGHEIAVFNKILCIGDSMTEGAFNHLDSGSTQWVTYSKYSYPTYLHKMTGIDVTNLGHGGSTSVQWYTTEQSNDLSGYDCAIIQLGINDYGAYGELVDATKTAFQNIITKLKTENKNIKIFVANIIPATAYSSAGYKSFSDDLLEWLKTTYSSDKNVIPVDIQKYGHTGKSEAYNAGHLTALGYRMLARDYIGFISDYIKNHGDIFREVQFIGTDYWYVDPNS